MAEAFNLLKRVRSLEVSPELSGYSGVRIYAGQDNDGNRLEYFAGDESGKVLEITNDWGNQAQANAIYNKILGYRYQPYSAIVSQIDPSVELGDAVTVSDVYSGVFSRRSVFGRQITSDVEAPFYDEIEHEFQIQDPTNRQYDRFTRQMRASLSITNAKILAEVEDRRSAVESLTAKLSIEANRITQEVEARISDVKTLTSSIDVQAGRITQEITDRRADVATLNSTLTQQADLIEARVTKTGGDSSSFGWSLSSSDWILKANGATVLRAAKAGLEITGKIVATSGSIGGFNILQDYLSYNGQVWNGTNTYGAYLGVSGFQMGQNFKVDMAGHLHATSGTFSGTVYAGQISYGSEHGTLNGAGITGGSILGGWDGQLSTDSVGTMNTTSGINTSLGHADYANGVFTGYNKASWIKAQQFTLGDYNMGWSTINYVDHSGNNRSLRVATGQ